MSASLTSKSGAEKTELTGVRKAAILLLALPQDAAATLMKKLSRDHVEDISREIAAIDRVSPELRQKVIMEFYNLVLARQYVDVGGLSLARSLLERTLTPEESKKIIDSIERQVYQQPFSFLQKTDKENLLMFLQGEHPQTIALILSHLPASMAAEILVGLDSDRQIEVVKRVAHMDQTSPDVIKEVERGLEKRLAGLVSERFERIGGVRVVAEILNLSGRASERAILDGITEQEPELVDNIRRLMFVFEDIVRVDDRGIQAVLKEVENEELAMALKTASDDLKQKILKNMSERAAQLVQEEMEYMGPVRVSDVEAAQQRIVDIVRRLEDAGEIVISGKGGEKDLVV